MKMMKRFLSMIGVMALIAASMVAGNVSADEIGTTLIVESSVPVCEDTQPSSINIRNPNVALRMPFTPITPTSATGVYSATSQNANVDFYINTCHTEIEWNVYVAFSDFTSENDDTLTSVGNLDVRGHSDSRHTGITRGGFSGPYITEGVQSLTSTAWVPYTGTPIHISTGTATNPVSSTTGLGGWTQNLSFQMRNIPGTTPPGTYVGQAILTLDVDAAP